MKDDQRSKECFNDMIISIGKETISFLNNLYKAIQENRYFKEAITNITNPFEQETKKEDNHTIKNSENLEIARKKCSSNRWTKVYEGAMIHASKETTPNKKRTLTYLVGILPFTEDAIRRKAYRMGFKWKKGKLVDRNS